jgi:hypothetical protein
MARIFTITCAAGTIRLAGAARGECAFTVTNTSANAARAQVEVVALDGRARAWFSVLGEAQRDFIPGQTGQFTVVITPSGAPPGRYGFRLDVSTGEGAGAVRTAGPEAYVELTAEAPPLVVPRGRFPWWWLLLAAVALLLVVGGICLALRGRSAGAPATAEAAPDSAPAPVEGRAAGTTSKEADALAQRWLEAYERRDAEALARLTSPPATIAGQRVTAAGALAQRYAAFLREPSPPAATAVKPARPMQTPIRSLRGRLPAEVGELKLDDDDLAVGVTVAASSQRLVLLIRRGPPASVAAVVR